MNILSLRSTNVIAQNDGARPPALGRASVLTDGCWVMRVHDAQLQSQRRDYRQGATTLTLPWKEVQAPGLGLEEGPLPEARRAGWGL